MQGTKNCIAKRQSTDIFNFSGIQSTTTQFLLSMLEFKLIQVFLHTHKYAHTDTDIGTYKITKHHRVLNLIKNNSVFRQ